MCLPRYAGFFKITEFRFVKFGFFHFAKTHANGVVAVFFLGSDTYNFARTRFYNGAAVKVAFFIKELGHAHFFADYKTERSRSFFDSFCFGRFSNGRCLLGTSSLVKFFCHIS